MEALDGVAVEAIDVQEHMLGGLTTELTASARCSLAADDESLDSEAIGWPSGSGLVPLPGPRLDWLVELEMYEVMDSPSHRRAICQRPNADDVFSPQRDTSGLVGVGSFLCRPPRTPRRARAALGGSAGLGPSQPPALPSNMALPRAADKPGLDVSSRIMRRGVPPSIQVPEVGADEEEEGGVSMLVGSARAEGPSTADGRSTSKRCFNARTPLPSKRDREVELAARVKAARLTHAEAPRRTVSRRRSSPSPPSDATQQAVRLSESEDEANSAPWRWRKDAGEEATALGGR